MKMKFSLKIVAMALVAIMCLGTASCGISGFMNSHPVEATVNNNENNPDANINGDIGSIGGADTSVSDSNTTTSTGNEEALFEELLKAIKASVAYDGAMTLSAVQSQSLTEGSENNDIKVIGTMGWDKATNRYFSTTEYKGSGSDASFGSYYSSTTSKLFTVDGILYTYKCDKSLDEGYSNEQYSKGAEDEITDEFEYFSDMIESFVGGVEKAKTYTELKTAFNKVFSEVKAKTEAEMKNDGKIKDGAMLTLVPTISIKKIDGEIVLSITSSMFISEMINGMVIMTNCSSTYTRNIRCKDGKITGLDMVVDASAENTKKENSDNEDYYDTPAYTEPAWTAGEETVKDENINAKDEIAVPDNSWEDNGTVVPPIYHETVSATMPSENAGADHEFDNSETKYHSMTATPLYDTVKTSSSVKTSSNISLSYDIAYSFDQKGYDAIAVNLPSPDEIYDEEEVDNYIDVELVEGLVIDEYVGDGTDPATFFECVRDIVMWRYGYDSDYVDGLGYVDTPHISVGNFYKDAARTQIIDPNTITADELRALGKIYADYTIMDGRALVISAYEQEYALSLEYEIVRATFLGGAYSTSHKEANIYYADDPFILSYDGKIAVNGVQMSEGEMKLENGKTYVITYTSIYTDADVDIEDLIMDF